jgi:hypothetical protein
MGVCASREARYIPSRGVIVFLEHAPTVEIIDRRRFQTMPNSKCQIFIHLVWATKKREPFILVELESIIQNVFLEKCRKFELEVLAFGNTEDHVHLFLSINPFKKLRMLLTWMDIHQEELIANWNLLINDDQYFKIEPLK